MPNGVSIKSQSQIKSLARLRRAGAPAPVEWQLKREVLRLAGTCYANPAHDARSLTVKWLGLGEDSGRKVSDGRYCCGEKADTGSIVADAFGQAVGDAVGQSFYHGSEIERYDQLAKARAEREANKPKARNAANGASGDTVRPNGVSLNDILLASADDYSALPGEGIVDASGFPRRLTGPGGGRDPDVPVVGSSEEGIWNFASDGELDFFPESTAFLNENASFMAKNEDIVAGYFSEYDDSSSIQISSSSSDGFSSVPYQHHLIDEVAGYGFGFAAQLITGGFSYFGLAGGAIESVFNGEWSDGRGGDFALSRAKQFGEVGASLTSWLMPDERSLAYRALGTTNELLSPIPPYIPGAGALASSIGSVAGYSRAVAGGLSDGSLKIATQNPYEGAVFGTFFDPNNIRSPLRLDVANSADVADKFARYGGEAQRAALLAEVQQASTLSEKVGVVARSRLQLLTDTQNSALAANPRIAQTVLSPAEYGAATREPWLANMQYGNAVERLVARETANTPSIDRWIEHVGGPNKPDFVGKGRLSGMTFDITTEAARAAHMRRSYGPGLNIIPYQRPADFSTFPR